MRPIDAEPSEGGVKLHSAIHGDGAYEAFKRIASEFYADHTYKFVALTLDGEPRPDIVTFTAEFWRVPDGEKDPPPNAPLTLEELREMDGEPVWLHTFSAVQKKTNIAQWAIVECVSSANAVFLRAGVNSRLTEWFCNYGTRWLAYRRKPEEGTSVGS